MLENKRVLVTGGTTGIGRAIVRQLLREGARVVTFGRDPRHLADALQVFRSCGGEVHGFAADLARRGDVARIFAEVDRKLGGLDLLVSNAALGADPLDAMTDEDWRYVVEVNLIGAMAVSRGALERMAAGGHIVIIGSISADIRAPGESVYSATKGGLQAFSETLRKEVAERGIRVSLIEPGSVGSDMQASSPEEQREKIGQAEMLPAEDIAEAVSFVAGRSERCDIVSLRIEPRIQTV